MRSIKFKRICKQFNLKENYAEALKKYEDLLDLKIKKYGG